MAWELTGDVEYFEATTREFLRSRPVQHTVLLTLIETLRRRGLHAYGEGTPIFGFWRDGEAVTGVLLQTPPRPVIFSEIPSSAIAPAAEVLSRLSLPGVNLLAGVADEFAAAWQRRTGAVPTIARRIRLYRLETLISPVSPPHGKPRPAGPDDRELLLRWSAEFQSYIGERATDLPAMTDDRLAYGGVTLWEDNGEPVSMAIRSRPAHSMVRVQCVYTPAEQRGHGYAAGATFTLTRDALANGVRDVVLNTDLANPTSNRLYSRLGYRPVEDRTVVEFSS